MQRTVKCLLVDDLDENLLSLSALLKQDNVEVLQARSGPEALELMLAHDVALALIDVQMPEMDGFELAELIRGSQRTNHVPLIFVTAGAWDSARLFKGYETGAVDFLYKPIDPFILKNKADVFFQLYRQKQLLAEQLAERTETLRLNEMFMAVLGHDLRNPLSAMLTSAQLLQRSSKEDIAQKTAVRLLASGKRMGRMIEDMLDLTRARLAGGIPLTRAPADLGALLRRMVQELSSAHPQRVIEVQQEGEDFSGEWDADRLAQVASNLIGNALEHGGADAPVMVRLDGASQEAVGFSVENAGCIPADVLPHIFDPFSGGQREPGRGEGLGLGLYIVQQIVVAHGGRVSVVSSGDPASTVFQVRLPRRAPNGIRL